MSLFYKLGHSNAAAEERVLLPDSDGGDDEDRSPARAIQSFAKPTRLPAAAMTSPATAHTIATQASMTSPPAPPVHTTASTITTAPTPHAAAAAAAGGVAVPALSNTQKSETEEEHFGRNEVNVPDDDDDREFLQVAAAHQQRMRATASNQPRPLSHKLLSTHFIEGGKCLDVNTCSEVLLVGECSTGAHTHAHAHIITHS